MGGFLGVCLRGVYFAASEILITKFRYDSCLLKKDETLEVKLIIFSWSWRLSQLVFVSMGKNK